MAPANLAGMTVWQRERVLALAPEAPARVAAQQLATASRWSALGYTQRCLWGRCQGSAQSPYETVVDLEAGPAYACSCPSRRTPCKHALGLLLLWSAGGVPSAAAEADFAVASLQVKQRAPERRSTELVDPEAATRRVAERADRVAAGLADLDRWLRDQVHGGLAGLEQAGYAHLDRVAARMVDAQAPGVAGMLRAIPAELAADGWPERVLFHLAALHLLVKAHRRLDELPAELAANVRSRIGYPVTKVQVLSSPGVRDRWVALGMVDTVEYQLETRRVWLRGTRSGRWAVWLSFAAPGMGLDATVLPGQLLDGLLHFYPGSSFRALIGEVDPATVEQLHSGDGAEVATVEGEDINGVRRRFAELLAADPWASRLPAVLSAIAVAPSTPAGTWRLRDSSGRCADVRGLGGDPWLLLARSGGEPIDVFGEWSGAGFRPLSVLPDQSGPFDSVLVA